MTNLVARAVLAEALARDLRQLSLDSAAVFVEAQQAEIERLHNQLLQHAETCKESAFPLGQDWRPSLEPSGEYCRCGCGHRANDTYCRSCGKRVEYTISGGMAT
jgi:hypothetical protein